MRDGPGWANLRVLAKASSTAQKEVAERVKVLEVVQRAGGGLAERHIQQEIKTRNETAMEGETKPDKASKKRRNSLHEDPRTP